MPEKHRSERLLCRTTFCVATFHMFVIKVFSTVVWGVAPSSRCSYDPRGKTSGPKRREKTATGSSCNGRTPPIVNTTQPLLFETYLMSFPLPLPCLHFFTSLCYVHVLPLHWDSCRELQNFLNSLQIIRTCEAGRSEVLLLLFCSCCCATGISVQWWWNFYTVVM